jgi:hypothetical protein
VAEGATNVGFRRRRGGAEKRLLVLGGGGGGGCPQRRMRRGRVSNGGAEAARNRIEEGGDHDRMRKTRGGRAVGPRAGADALADARESGGNTYQFFSLLHNF